MKKTKEELKRNKEVVIRYIRKKSYLGGRNIKVPIELKYLRIGKACKLSYKQVRLIVNKLIKEGTLEKWRKYVSKKCTQNFYRLKNINQ